jgi:hypothetical protein
MKLFTKLFFCFIIVFPSFAKAQCDSLHYYMGDPEDNVKELGRGVVEYNPEFPGGDDARVAFFKENLKLPDNWHPDSIVGKVFITFAVDVDGKIKYPCILRGLNPILDSIAIAAIRKMPNWIPAKNRGVPVRLEFILPIQIGSDRKQK